MPHIALRTRTILTHPPPNLKTKTNTASKFTPHPNKTRQQKLKQQSNNNALLLLLIDQEQELQAELTDTRFQIEGGKVKDVGNGIDVLLEQEMELQEELTELVLRIDEIREERVKAFERGVERETELRREMDREMGGEMDSKRMVEVEGEFEEECVKRRECEGFWRGFEGTMEGQVGINGGRGEMALVGGSGEEKEKMNGMVEGRKSGGGWMVISEWYSEWLSIVARKA